MSPAPSLSPTAVPRTTPDAPRTGAGSATPEISAIVPVYNEREALPPFMEELERALEGTGLSYEIVLVDDASTDGSVEWIREAARRSAPVVGVFFERNAGQSAAVTAGIRISRGDILVTLDADGQNDPADIPLLLDRLRDADVVSGVRASRQDTWTRKVSSRIANGFRRALLGDTITDIGCSLKAYRRAAVDGLPAFVGVHRFLPALCQFRGARVVEVPVRHRHRVHGQSKYGIGNRLFRGLRDVFGVMWLRARLLDYRIREVTHE